MIGRESALSMSDQHFLVGVIAIYLSVILHELGHAVMARLCGFLVTSLGLGFGGKSLAFSVGRTRVYWTTSRPLQGLTFTFAPDLYASRWSYVAMLAGGVIANALAAGVCLGLWWHGGPWASMWGVVAAVNGMLLTSILPLQMQVGGLTLRSDGAQILDRIRGKAEVLAPLIIQNVRALRGHLGAVGDRLGLRVNLVCAGLACEELGLTGPAEATLAEAETVPVSDPPAVLQPLERLLRATIARQSGRFEEAEIEAELAETDFRELGHEVGLLLASVMRADLQAITDLPGALALLEGLRSHPLLTWRAELRAILQASRLRLLCSCDDAEVVDQACREYEEVRRLSPSDTREIGVQWALAQWAERRGDLARAVDAYEAMLKGHASLVKMWADPADAEEFREAQAFRLDAAEACLARAGRSVADVTPELGSDFSAVVQAREEAHRQRDGLFRKAGRRLFLVNVAVGASVLGLILAERTDFFQRPLTPRSIPVSSPQLLGMFLAAVLLALTAFGGAAVLVVRLLGRGTPSLRRNYGKMVVFWAVFPWMVAFMTLVMIVVWPPGR